MCSKYCFLGDNSPHDVWNETDSTQTQASKLVVDYLSDRLSSLDVSIYPAMGNHGRHSNIVFCKLCCLYVWRCQHKPCMGAGLYPESEGRNFYASNVVILQNT